MKSNLLIHSLGILIVLHLIPASGEAKENNGAKELQQFLSSQPNIPDPIPLTCAALYSSVDKDNYNVISYWDFPKWAFVSDNNAQMEASALSTKVNDFRAKYTPGHDMSIFTQKMVSQVTLVVEDNEPAGSATIGDLLLVGWALPFYAIHNKSVYRSEAVGAILYEAENELYEGDFLINFTNEVKKYKPNADIQSVSQFLKAEDGLGGSLCSLAWGKHFDHTSGTFHSWGVNRKLTLKSPSDLLDFVKKTMP